MAKDQNIYRKEGRRYIPVGICEPVNWIPDGIWLVRSEEHSKRRTNMKWLSEFYGFNRLGDIPARNFTQIADMENYVDIVSKVLLEHKAYPNDMCIDDLSRKVVQAMFNINKDCTKK